VVGKSLQNILKFMKKVTKKAFIKAILDDKKDVVIQGIKDGIDIAIVSEQQKDGRRPPIEFASFVNNYGLLHLLWQHKAVATTTFVTAIFEQFGLGVLPQELYEKDRTEKLDRLSKVELDLTDNFAAANLILQKIDLNFDEGGSEIIVSFEPFKFNNEVFERNLEFYTDVTLDILPNCEYYFTADETSSSIYFDNVHNPVDMRRLKFGEKMGKKIALEIELFFDFEFENTPLKNETVILSYLMPFSS
jgi:hypothetical protein